MSSRRHRPVILRVDNGDPPKLLDRDIGRALTEVGGVDPDQVGAERVPRRHHPRRPVSSHHHLHAEPDRSTRSNSKAASAFLTLRYDHDGRCGDGRRSERECPLSLRPSNCCRCPFEQMRVWCGEIRIRDAPLASEAVRCDPALSIRQGFSDPLLEPNYRSMRWGVRRLRTAATFTSRSIRSVVSGALSHSNSLPAGSQRLSSAS